VPEQVVIRPSLRRRQPALGRRRRQQLLGAPLRRALVDGGVPLEHPGALQRRAGGGDAAPRLQRRLCLGQRRLSARRDELDQGALGRRERRQLLRLERPR
jgi:hypothetical protein